MFVRQILPGERGVDFAYSKPPASRVRELGFTFVVGYCSPNPNKNLLDPWAYLNAGLGVVYVFEISATRPAQGAIAGASDGAFAWAWLHNMGYPFEVPVVVAFDTNTTATNIAAHVAYWNAFKSAVGPYKVGAYEDTDLAKLTNAETTIDWLPLAWSWSGSSLADAQAKAKALGFHVFQEKGFYIDNLWAVDSNTVIRSFVAWGSPREEDMRAVFFSVAGVAAAQFLWVPGQVPFAFTNPTDRDVILKNLGIMNPDGSLVPGAGGEISQEMFDRIVASATVAVPAPVVNVPPVVFPNYIVTKA